MDIWLVYGRKGILESFGWFETEEECQRQCDKINQDFENLKVKAAPLKISKSA